MTINKFPAVPDNKKYTITIEVFENCIGHHIEDHRPDKPESITFFEVFGALDYLKNIFFLQQQTENIKLFLKKKDKLLKKQNP